MQRIGTGLWARALGVPATKIANATIAVYVYGSNLTTLATIYTDDNGTVGANPFAADQYGAWFCYLADGRYDVRVTGGTPPLTVPYVYGDISVGLGDSGVLSSTQAALLPTSGNAYNAGRLARVTDQQRGLWMDTGAHWFPLNVKRINIMEFGADPTGVNDSTQAFLDAIACPVAPGDTGGLVIDIPVGTFKITQTLYIPPTTGVSFIGQRIEATRLVWHGGNNSVMILYDSILASSPQGDQICNLALINGVDPATGLPYTGMTGMQFTATAPQLQNRVFELISWVEFNSFFDAGGNGCGLRITGNADFFYVEYCNFFLCDSGLLGEHNSIPSNGILSRSSISHSAFTNCIRAAIAINGFATFGNAQILIENNVIEWSDDWIRSGDGATGIYLDGMRAVVIQNNYFYFKTTTGTLINLCPGVAATGFVVQGNLFSFESETNAAQIALRIVQANGVVVSGNTFWRGYNAVNVSQLANNVILMGNVYINSTVRVQDDASFTIILDEQVGVKGLTTHVNFFKSAALSINETASYEQTGNWTIQNGQTFVDITFYQAFSASPHIVVTATPGTIAEAIGVTNVTTTGCRLFRVGNVGANAIFVRATGPA